MKYFSMKNKIGLLLATCCILLFASCNKGIYDIPEPEVVPPTGLLLGETIQDDADFGLYYKLIEHAGMVNSINDANASFTLFVPDDNGMKIFINAVSGGLVPISAPISVFEDFINNNIPVASAQAIVAYNTVPQKVPFESVPDNFPNLQYPTVFNPAPSISALLRLTTFPSRMNGNWVNNIPVLATNMEAANGMIHQTYTVVVPPTRFIWDRISSDPDLTIFKAALERADSGAVGSASLIAGLANIGANFTVLAPNNQALKNAISYLSGGLLQPTDPDAFFIALLGSNQVTTQMLKGIAVYHMFDGFSNTADPALSIQRPGRFFTNNMPTTATAYPTLLSSANTSSIAYPPVIMQATFGAAGVTAATVKGAFNPTPSNFLINPLPDPYGTSDQHFLNGTMHVIDQVLLPSP